MWNRGVAIVIAAACCLAQTAGAEARSTGRHESHSHPGLHDHRPRDHPRTMHENPDQFHLHNLHARIDGATELTEAERAKLHETADRAGRTAAEMQEATRILEDLRAEGAGQITAARKAEIEAEVASQLARIESGQSDLQAQAGQLQTRIEAEAALTAAEKEKLSKLVELAKQRKLTPRQAEQAAGELGATHAQAFALILVEFILLIIIGVGG